MSKRGGGRDAVACSSPEATTNEEEEEEEESVPAVFVASVAVFSLVVGGFGNAKGKVNW